MRQRETGDAGFSLAEMLVVIVMMTLVMGSITAVVITSLKHQRSLAARGSALAQVRTALEQVDRDIRSANPLCSASATEVVVERTYPTTMIADYVVSGTTLVYKRYNVAAGTICQTSGSAITTRTLLTDVVSGTTVFTIPSSPTFDTCPDSGTVPNVSYAAGTNNISSLTVSIAVKPATLSSSVRASDCGTLLRNYTPS